MSSEQEIVLYKKLYEAIEDIFNRKGLKKKLNPINIDQDKILISIIFRSISTSANEDFINWNDEEWVESMKIPEICMLSFLYKKQLTLYKIYNMTSNAELKENLLTAYKKLVNMVKFLESLEKASNLFVDTSVDIDKIKNKQLQIALNIRNYKDPKNLANIIDLLYHKQFRDNVLKNFLKGIDKVDLSVLKSFADDEKVSYASLIEKYLTQDNITKLLIFLMKIDIKGDVFVSEKLYNNVKEYMNDVIKNSDQIQKLFNHIEETVSDCKLPYKNKINVKLLDNTKDFIQECRQSTNKITLTKDIFTSFDSFNNGEYVKFKSIDLVKRIRDLIFIFIQKVMEFASLPKDEKVSLFNTYLKEYVLSNFENDEDFLTIDKNYIQNNDETRSLKSELSMKMKDLIRELVDSLANDEDIKDIIAIKNEFIETLKYVIQLDFSNIEKKEFNIINNLVEKLFKKPNQLKFLIIKFLNADIIKKYVTKFEEDSSIRINPEIKRKIAEKSVTALEELVNILIDTKDLQDLEKFALFVSKGVDYLFYYALKLKSSDLKQKIVKQKKVIAQKR